jgi:hypothetical protein
LSVIEIIEVKMRSLLVIVSSIVFTIGPWAATAKAGDADRLTTTDLAVYQAALAPHCKSEGGRFSVLSSKTSGPPPHFPEKGFDTSALIDLRRRAIIESRIPSNVDCAGVTVAEEQTIQKALASGASTLPNSVPGMATTAPWRGFYRAFPDAGDLMTLSKPGYAQAGEVALVYMSQECGGLCGYSQYITLRRINGEWKISDDFHGERSYGVGE